MPSVALILYFVNIRRVATRLLFAVKMRAAEKVVGIPENPGWVIVITVPVQVVLDMAIHARLERMLAPIRRARTPGQGDCRGEESRCNDLGYGVHDILVIEVLALRTAARRTGPVEWPREPKRQDRRSRSPPKMIHVKRFGTIGPQNPTKPLNSTGH
jgi:hypothetical protein